ncbi:MAG: hypothetical protein GEU74_00125 [Nitriliruptorales bacterium]|nr:hypothetical protein [Nitriliruptorales bacterium]
MGAHQARGTLATLVLSSVVLVAVIAAGTISMAPFLSNGANTPAGKNGDSRQVVTVDPPGSRGPKRLVEAVEESEEAGDQEVAGDEELILVPDVLTPLDPILRRLPTSGSGADPADPTDPTVVRPRPAEPTPTDRTKPPAEPTPAPPRRGSAGTNNPQPDPDPKSETSKPGKSTAKTPGKSTAKTQVTSSSPAKSARRATAAAPRKSPAPSKVVAHRVQASPPKTASVAKSRAPAKTSASKAAPRKQARRDGRVRRQRQAATRAAWVTRRR